MTFFRPESQVNTWPDLTVFKAGAGPKPRLPVFWFSFKKRINGTILGLNTSGLGRAGIGKIEADCLPSGLKLACPWVSLIKPEK